MVRKVDQERVQALLRDTITLLCKNGLQFKCRFSIDAVIGVTVDDDEIFLVAMNEVVKSDTPRPATPHNENDSENLSNSSDEVVNKRMKIDESDNDDEVESKYVRPRIAMISEDNSSPIKRKRRHSNYNVVSVKDTANINVVKKEADVDADVVELVNLSPEPSDLKTEIQFSGFSSDDARGSFTASTFISPTSDTQIQQESQPGHSQPVYTPQTYSQPPYSEPGQLQAVRFEGRLACSICPRIFHDSESLANHEMMHTTTYKFHCKFCMKGFLAKSDYEGHLAMHTGQKQFRCELCGKQYSYRKTLKDHMIFSHNQRR